MQLATVAHPDRCACALSQKLVLILFASLFTTRPKVLAAAYSTVALLTTGVVFAFPAYRRHVMNRVTLGARALGAWTCFCGLLTAFIDDPEALGPGILLYIGWALLLGVAVVYGRRAYRKRRRRLALEKAMLRGVSRDPGTASAAAGVSPTAAVSPSARGGAGSVEASERGAAASAPPQHTSSDAQGGAASVLDDVGAAASGETRTHEHEVQEVRQESPPGAGGGGDGGGEGAQGGASHWGKVRTAARQMAIVSFWRTIQFGQHPEWQPTDPVPLVSSDADDAAAEDDADD